MSLSKRLQKLQGAPSAIVTGHITCSTDPYSETNTQGYLNFGVAENHLMDDILLKKLNEKLVITHEHIHYNGVNGLDSFKNSTVHFFEKFLNLSNLDPNKLVIQCGVSSICESLSFSLFDEGDYILIPTPYYTGFDHDFTKRFKVNFLKAHLKAENQFKHNIDVFRETYLNSPHKDKVKAILITSPHNPTGEIISNTFMDDLIAFAKEFDLHIISDEIYALSTHNNTEHRSLYQKAIDAKAKAHLLYGMAKDFAIAGFKVGFFYSEDQDLVDAMNSVTYFHPVGTATQEIVKGILDDKQFIETFKKINSERLNKIKEDLISGLNHLTFTPAQAGLFLMLDLSTWCETFEDEDKIFNDLLRIFKINFSKGSDLGMNKPGYFRVCFARPMPQIKEITNRLANLKRPN